MPKDIVVKVSGRRWTLDFDNRLYKPDLLENVDFRRRFQNHSTEVRLDFERLIARPHTCYWLDEKPKIRVLNGGGTVDSVDVNGHAEKIDTMPLNIKRLIFNECFTPRMLDVEIGANFFNEDSSEMEPDYGWSTLSRELKRVNRSDHLSGVLIPQGTDTLEYTTTWLSYVIRHSNVPIVLTGAMIPPRYKDPLTGKIKYRIRDASDGFDNMSNGAFVAGYGDISGPVAVFNGRLLVPKNLGKDDSERRNAFRNYGGVRTFGHVDSTKLSLQMAGPDANVWGKYPDWRRPPYDKAQVLMDDIDVQRKAKRIELSTYMKADDLEDEMNHKKYAAYLIGAFGSGTVPTRFLDVIEGACREGKFVVPYVKPIHGRASFVYSNARSVFQRGKIDGIAYVMTAGNYRPSTIEARLNYILNKERDVHELAQLTKEYPENVLHRLFVSGSLSEARTPTEFILKFDGENYPGVGWRPKLSNKTMKKVQEYKELTGIEISPSDGLPFYVGEAD